MVFFTVKKKVEISEKDLVNEAVAWLRERFPDTWVVDRVTRGPSTLDSTIQIRSPDRYATLAVEARRQMSPRDLDRLFGTMGRQLKELAPGVSFLVVAPWLSERTREALKNDGINFLDLTGNSLVRLENPAVYIETSGSHRNPLPAYPSTAGVRGPRASRLVRTLIDVNPPYGVTELALATGLTPGYVSRLLESLDREALVDRGQRGRVESVDVPGLIRRWIENYGVFEANSTKTYIAPRGPLEVLDRLRRATTQTRVAVTGSFAAVRLAPIASPSLLCIYSDDTERIATDLDLLPADEGANVALLQPYDSVVWANTSDDAGVTYVSISQVAADCLTGNGRMPAEGDAVISWMIGNEAAWRLKSLSHSGLRQGNMSGSANG